MRRLARALILVILTGAAAGCRSAAPAFTPSVTAAPAATLSPSPRPPTSTAPPPTLTPAPSPSPSPTPATVFLASIQQAPPAARLVIPALSLDREVQPVPITSGRWDVKTLVDAVGWLTTTGDQPGADLAPALVGHVSLADGIAGPFGDLWRLKLGADLYYDWLGRRYHYQVDDKRRITPQSVDDLYVADGQRLLLVTCDGWDYASWRYTERLLVTALLVDAAPAP